MKKPYVRHISGKERRWLKKIFKRGKGRISYRALIILLAISICPSYSVSQIAAITQSCRQTIYNTIARFNRYGIFGLMDKRRSGRPVSISLSEEEKLLDLFENKKPSETGKYIHSKWSLKLIRDYLRQNYQIEVCDATVSRWLGRKGWSYSRSKRELLAAQALNGQTKQDVIDLLEALKDEDDIILFVDQSAFYLDGLPSGTWGPVGKQKEIPASGNREKFWIFGAFNPRTKKVYFRICQECNSYQMVLFLGQLRQRFPGKTIHIVLDNASFHKSAETDYFVFHHKEIVFHFLPARGAKLNPIERFWEFAKSVTVASAVYNDMDELYHSLRRFFWHYNQGNIEYNFDIQKLIDLWKRWPSIPPNAIGLYSNVA